MATKPTITQYNSVYGGLRQNAQDDFDLLREWILSLSPGGGVVNTTYADLVNLYNDAELVPGQWYCVQNYRSRNLIPNTTDYHEGTDEPLLVFATTTDELSQFAISQARPTDLIYYDLFNTNFGADRGRIIYRRDFDRNLEAFYDFREVTFRRWDDGAGNFVVLTDNGNAFEDFITFDNVGNWNISIPMYRTTLGIVLNNIIFGRNCEAIMMGPNCRNMTFQTNNKSIRIGADCSNFRILNNNSNLTFGSGCSAIAMVDQITSAVFGNRCLNITLGSGISAIEIGEFNVAVAIDSDSSAITTGDGNNSITLTGPCSAIRIGNGNIDINLTESNYTTVGNGCGSINASYVNGYIFSDNVNNRTCAPISSSVKAFHTYDSIDIWCEINFLQIPGNVGVLPLESIPTGSTIDYCTLSANALVGPTATVALGVEVDSPTGILTATSIADPLFNGDISNTNADWITHIPTAGTTDERFVTVTIGNVTITSGILKLRYQISVFDH